MLSTLRAHWFGYPWSVLSRSSCQGNNIFLLFSWLMCMLLSIPNVFTCLQSVEYFSQLFDIPYPLPKLDLVAVPDFSPGAMENWGLITFRTHAVLLDEHSTNDRQREIAVTVIHEISHQVPDLSFMLMSGCARLELDCILISSFSLLPTHEK